MYAPQYSHVECQQCGAILKELSPAQQQKIAQDPYNFIFYCHTCIKDIEKIYETESYS